MNARQRRKARRKNPFMSSFISIGRLSKLHEKWMTLPETHVYGFSKGSAEPCWTPYDDDGEPLLKHGYQESELQRMGEVKL